MRSYKILTKTSYVLALFIVMVLVFLSSCQEENQSPPVITGVRVLNPAKRDSTFTRAFPGAKVIIEGKNLNGISEVYFNNKFTSFNPAYNSNTSLIIQIPHDSPTLANSSDPLPNKVRVVTDHGVSEIEFMLLAPEPEITLFKFEAPATVGKPMEIVGKNFYDVKKIIFKVNEVMTAEVTNFAVSDSAKVLSFTIPSGGTQDGTVTVITESGESTEVFLSDPIPQFLSISDDIQVPGASITIRGKYLTFIDRVVFPGDIAVSKENFKMNNLFTEIEVKVPLEIGKTAGKIKLLTEFDVNGERPIESPILFNDWSGVFLDWDGKGGTWGKEKAETVDPAKPPFLATGKFGHFLGKTSANEWGWNDALLLLVNSVGSYPSPTGISDDTPISKIAFAFNYYTTSDWNAGWWNINFGAWSSNNYRLEPHLQGPVKKNTWTTYSIPLNVLINSTGQTTWGQVKSSFPASNDFFNIMFRSKAETEISAYWDNLRFTKLP
jgi:hypothetical protein